MYLEGIRVGKTTIQYSAHFNTTGLIAGPEYCRNVHWMNIVPSTMLEAGRLYSVHMFS